MDLLGDLLYFIFCLAWAEKQAVEGDWCVVKATNVLYLTLKSRLNYVIIGLSIKEGVGGYVSGYL